MSLAMATSSFYMPGGVFVVSGRKRFAPFTVVAATANSGGGGGLRLRVSSFLFDPTREPLLKQALKEPVAFMGGMFAGLLRLDLNDDPLKEWITRTVEASGITEEDEVKSGETQAEESSPQLIQID